MRPTSSAICILGLLAAAPMALARVETTPVSPEHIGPAVSRVYEADDGRIEAAAAALAEQDVELIDVDVCIDPERYRLSATAKLSVAAEASVIELSLNDGLSVLSVTGGTGPLRFLRDGTKLAIRPGPTAGSAMQLTVRYEGVLTPGDDIRLMRGLVFLGERALWYPAPRYGDRFRSRTVVRYPEGYTSVCTGALAGMTPSRAGSQDGCALGDVWETGVPVPCAAVAVGTFASSYSVWGDLFLGYHVLVGPGGEAPTGMEASTAEIKGLVRYLENCYGPYPFEWLSVISVPGFPSGKPVAGVGPGLALVTESEPARGSGHQIPADRLVGALSKSWWPYSIDTGLIVSEGLAAHSEVSLLRESGDEESAVGRREGWRDRYIAALADSGGRAPLLPCIEHPAKADMRICSTRSAFFLGVVEEVIGADAFCAALRDLGSRFANGMLPLREVVGAFERADGRELDWLVYEWIFRGDLPTYVLSYDVAEAKRGYIVSGSLRQLGEIFRTPLPLTVDLGVWSYDEWIAIDSSEQSFSFRAELEPQSISIDSEMIVPRIEADELANVHFERGTRAAEGNEWGRAVDEFGAATSLVPNDPDYKRSYGEALVHSGRTALGLAALEEAVTLNPDDAAGRLRLARLYLAAGKNEDALRHVDRYVRRRDKDPAGHAVRAMALVRLGKLPAAEQELSLASSLAESGDVGDSVRELLSLASGRLYEAAGDVELAIASYRAALRFNPVSDEARRALARLSAPPH